MFQFDYLNADIMDITIKGFVMEISKTNLFASMIVQNKESESKKSDLGIKNLYTEKLSADEAKELRQTIVDNANAFTFNLVGSQSNVASNEDTFQKNYDEFQAFLKDIGYNGKNIAELSKDEAKKLVSEDGFFGIKQTADRITNFVLKGAGEDESLLRAGREGILEGLKQAEEIWGSKLPEISYKTINQAIQNIDMAMNDLGFSILNQEA